MTHLRKADLRDLAEFATYLDEACRKNGIAKLAPYNSRKFAMAPDKVEFCAHHGIDILKLESRGIYSPDSDNSTYSRLLEEQLNRDFWPSNNSQQLGLPMLEPLPELGTDEQPMPAGELPSSLSRFLQQTPPGSLPQLAQLLLGCVARAKSTNPSKRPQDSFEPSSRKTKTGRREYAKAPTFQQWAQTSGVKLTWLSNNAVQEGTKVFNRLLESFLASSFWPRHRDERRHAADAPEPAGSREERVVRRPGSVTIDARRDAPARPDVVRQGDSGKITLWLETSFTDFDADVARTFLKRFPRIDLGTILDVARTLWRQADGRQGDDKYVNLQKFLYRVGAVYILKELKPSLAADEVQNYIFFELNQVYATVTAGCQMVCHQPVNPYDLLLKMPAMPAILDMTDLELSACVQRVLTVAARSSQTPNSEQYLEALAIAVRDGGETKEQREDVNALAKEVVAKQVADPQTAFTVPPPLGVGGDTLYALQRTDFGLQSTQDMVRTAIRKGLTPAEARGPEWVVPSGVGGGQIQHRKGKEGLLRAQVEEAIRDIRADYGVDAKRAKEVQEAIDTRRGTTRTRRIEYDSSADKIKKLIATARRRETAAINKMTRQELGRTQGVGVTTV